MKRLDSFRDLAVGGAAAAFAEPLHVGRPNLGDRQALFRRLDAILDNRWLSNNGPMVQALEREIGARLGVPHVVAVCNATIALEVMARALGLRGEVIVPSYTFVATAHALEWLGLTPVFADIDPATHNLDPAAVARAVTPRTTGILGVHLWGRPAPVADLQAIADRHGLALYFDAAHAFGCSLDGVPVGGFGRCEVFSFHATKFFNTFEGGAITTRDAALAARLRLMINFGFSGYDNVISAGTNGKMTEVCAAMGLTGLESLDAFVAANRRNYECYRRELDGMAGLSLLAYDPRQTPNYQYVVAEVGPQFPLSRDDVVAVLQAENVLARRYFWPGCHGMPYYRERMPAAGERLPGTQAVAQGVVVLPTGSAVSEETVAAVAAIVRLAADNAPAVRRALSGRK
jgi:dTDP-4-amino-4,6-dideoxygalactose transaminase